MASVIRRGKYWHATWRKKDGKTVTKRTRILVRQEGKSIMETRALAQQMAHILQQASLGETPLEVLEAALRSVAVANGLARPIPTIGEYLDTVVATAGHSNENNRRRAFTMFRRFLGERVHLPLNRITVELCREWVRWELSRVRPSTVGLYKGYITAALKKAYIADRYLDRNPMDVVSVAAEAKAMGVENDHTPRQAFTPEEMRTLLYSFPAPWCDMAAASYFLAGLRLSDVCLLRWESVDFEHGVVKLREKKTRNYRTLTLQGELRERLLAIRSTQQEREEFVFPAMARRYLYGSASTISTDFTALLRAHGMVDSPKGEQQTGNRHHCSPKSFHSIRHSAVSIARTDPTLSADVVRETVGHASEEVERGYYHAPLEAQRRVLNTLAAAVAPAAAEAPANDDPLAA